MGIRLRGTCSTPEMAVKALRKAKTLVDEGKYLEKKHKTTETFGKFAERYLKWVDDIGQGTAYDKRKHLNTFKAYFGAERLLDRIAQADVENFQAYRLSCQTRRKRPVEPATVNREMATLHHLYEKGIQWKVVMDNPVRDVKPLETNNRRLRFLTPEECQRLLDICPTQDLRNVVILALHTGMCRGEILNLRWVDVNLREAYIEITRQKNNDRSTIPLNSAARAVLRSIPRRLDSDYVFTGLIPGEPYVDLKHQFDKAVKKAKLAGVSFHTLRHTCASHLVMAGVDLATVREILRHKSIEMTLRYSHLAPEHRASAVEALCTALSGEAENAAKTA